MSAAQADAPRVTFRLLAAMTIVLAIVFAAITAPTYLFGSDSARYVALARSIVHGQGYEVFGRPELSYPPGFPVFLTPIALLFGDGFVPMARWAALTGALVLPAVYRYARNEAAALPVALLTVCSAGFLDIIVGNPRSELIYIVCSFGFLAWAREAPGGRRVAVGAALLLMTVASRSIGVAAVGAVVMVLLEGRLGASRKLVVPLLVSVGFLVAWFAWTAMAPKGENTTGDAGYVRALFLLDPHQPDLGRVSLLPFLARIAGNLLAQITHSAELLTQLPWLKPRWFSPVAAATTGCFLFGWWTEIRSGWRLAAWYFAAYVAILLVWPYDEGVRFLVPILPLLWLYSFAGIRHAAAAVVNGSRAFRAGIVAVALVGLSGAAATYLAKPGGFSRQDQLYGVLWTMLLGVATVGWKFARACLGGAAVRRLAPALVIGGLVLYAAAGVARTAPTVLAQNRGAPIPDPVTQALREASDWIREHTPPDATIQASLSVPMQFATGRRVVTLPKTRSPERLRAAIESGRPDYLMVLRDTEHPYFQPVDSEKFSIVQTLFPGAWHEVAALRGSSIYARR